jgi:glycosyltransferase involved in cell wall biosynthesis
MPDRTTVRVLHVHDVSFTTENLLAAARRQGLAWQFAPLPWYYRRAFAGPPVGVVRISRRWIWDAALALRSWSVDIVHVHAGQLAMHTRFVRRPVVVHLHGNDIRSRQYEERWRAAILYGMSKAQAVLFSTPDLAEHAHKHRLDAEYFPVPIDTTAVPAWTPAARPRVVFASRWEAVKGSAAQLEVAAELRKQAPDVELVGVNWAERAADARRLGVRLVPMCTHAEYLALLATAHVVVGQMARILSASELEALAIGIPLVGGFLPEWYPGLGVLDDGTATPSKVACAVIGSLRDPEAAAARQDGQAWVRREHDAAMGVRRLLSLYDRLLGG